MVNNIRPRSQYPSRPVFWHPSRMGAEYRTEDGRFMESPEMRGRPWTINRALTEVCGIPGRTFFVAAEDNGRLTCFTTPFGSSQLDHGVFFDKEAFMKEVDRVQQANNKQFDESELGFSPRMTINAPETNRTTRDRRQYSKALEEGCVTDVARRSKKRPRAASKQRGTGSTRQDKMPMAAMQPKKGIRIGDGDAVYAFYDHRLRCCQQNACKMIAKAWVKVVAPKKQSTHPYTGGKKTRPDWWPETYYILDKDIWRDLRHKEPDHLNKDERVYLLCHILRMLVEPKQSRHPALQKVGLDLDALETASFDALSTWFNDKDAPANGEKRLFLKEIFKVARHEANYKDGGLDGNTEVFVKPISPEASQDAESDDEENCGQILTPASSVEPSDVQMVMHQVQVHEHGETGHFAGNSFAENMPIRTSHYPNPGFEPEVPERQNYLEAPSMGNHAPSYGHSHLGLSEMYPSPQESGRRSSAFNSPTTPVMYPPWSSSNNPGNAPMYSLQSQPHGVQAFGGQMAQDPSYTTSYLDGLPRPDAEAHHADVFASRDVGQGAIHHQSVYPNFVTDGASVGPNVKIEGGRPPSLSQ
ncbi:hypothetical protein F4680DRAFT_354443 [Xylaria scruposa]|nr:hypothetical protein F4680DRAFT_354443 [Xylaria scruposa]